MRLSTNETSIILQLNDDYKISENYNIKVNEFKKIFNKSIYVLGEDNHATNLLFFINDDDLYILSINSGLGINNHKFKDGYFSPYYCLKINYSDKTKINETVYNILCIINFSILYNKLRNYFGNNYILQQENDELKENNDELKENVDDLEHNVEELEENLLTFKSLEKNLREDINTLKKVVGLVGDNSSDAIKELKIILKNLSEENKKHEFLVKNQIISYLYQNKDKIDNFKEFLIELYKDISWNEIVSKIKLESL